MARKISEEKIIAEVAPLFLENPFGLRFTALVISTGVIKGAVPAAFEIGAAGRTGLRATDPVRDAQFFPAAVTTFHVERP